MRQQPYEILDGLLKSNKTNALTLILNKQYYDHSAYYVNIYTEDKKLIYTSEKNYLDYFMKNLLRL